MFKCLLLRFSNCSTFWIGWYYLKRATVDYFRQRIYYGENLFCCLLYLHTVTVDRSSLYIGFISHRQPKTCPKDMFVSNTMNNCCSDKQWVMEIYSVFFCLRLIGNVLDLSGHTLQKRHWWTTSGEVCWHCHRCTIFITHAFTLLYVRFRSKCDI